MKICISIILILATSNVFALDCHIYNESHYEMLPTTTMTKIPGSNGGYRFTYDLVLDQSHSINFDVDFDLTKPEQYALRAENRPWVNGDDVLAGSGGEYNGSFLVFFVKTKKGLMTINCSGAK